jgi:hypothetical protein
MHVLEAVFGFSVEILINVDMVVKFNCRSRSHDLSGRKLNNGIRFFTFLSGKKQQGKQVEELTRRRRIAWGAAIMRKNLTYCPPLHTTFVKNCTKQEVVYCIFLDD